MKNKIILLYILTVITVLISVMTWEFWLEPLVNANSQVETTAQKWEYITTVLIFCAIALIPAALFSLNLEKKRQTILNSLEDLQNKTATLLQERTVELATVKRQLIEGTFSRGDFSGEDAHATTRISLQTLIDSISDTILVIDTNYQVRMLNKAARDAYIKGSRSQDIPTCHKLTHDNDDPCGGPEHECPFKIVMDTGESCTVTHHHFNKEGQKIPYEIMASPIHDDDGNVIGIIELARDVSTRVALEKRQKEADARLLDLQRQQSIATLAGGLAHEFNNILTSILGNAELLNVRLHDHDINKKQAEAIIEGSEQLADLTKQLLAFAKGGKYLNQSLSVNDLIHDSLHLISSERFSDIDIEFNLAEDLWSVQGDPAQISQLIMNIIINGFEALEKAEGKLIITTSNESKTEKWRCRSKNIHPPGDYVHLSITNTGSTIADKLIDKLFDPFFSTKFTGRGMGLAAAKGIVENHNGCIAVESKKDQTTFQVFLPMAVDDDEILGNGRQAKGNKLDLKVLVVDDEPQVLTIIKSLLNHQGCDVLSADKGMEALEIIKRHGSDLDLVILDIQMPDMTGDKVYSRLKKNNPALKVLISSGYDEYTALKNVLLDPRDKYIKKPFRMSELMLKIKEVMTEE